MTFFSRLSTFLGFKNSEARKAIAVQRLGQPAVTNANYLGFSKEGYQKNVTVYRCIRLIATACAGIKWEVYQNGRELESHPIIDLMHSPNPLQGWSSFFESVIAYFNISGNSYIEGIGPTPNGPPTELYPIRPDMMRIIPNALGGVGEYQFKTSNVIKTWPADPITGKSRILHVKSFHPTDIWYGQSPIEAVILNVDQANAANKWNLSLLQNMASPSGVLRIDATEANPTASLTSEQRAQLQNAIESRYSGASNSGRPMILEGGMSWQTISLSPREMEWLESKKVTSADICNAFGVPAQLLGFGQTTYANYKEAREAFYTDTILPMMDLFEYELTRYVRFWFGEQYELKYDRDDIEALTEKREAKYSIINNLNFLTQNEKRIMAGFEPKEDWDVFLIGSKLIQTPDELSSTPNQNISSLAEEQTTKQKVPDKLQEGEQIEELIEAALDQPIQWKSFNLLTEQDRRKSWRMKNRMRMMLEKPFAKALEEDFEKLSKALASALEVSTNPKLVELSLQKAIDENFDDLERTLKRFISLTVREFGDPILQEAKSLGLVHETKSAQTRYEFWARDYIKTQTATQIQRIDNTTRKAVRRVVKRLTEESLLGDGLSESEFQERLLAEFDELTPARAATIARTEVHTASANAELHAVEALQIPGMKKEWIAALDDRTRDDHAVINGEKIPIDEKFELPDGSLMDGPGDTSADASQIINCRCTLGFGVT
jgi:HK97 family phage portal protein